MKNMQTDVEVQKVKKVRRNLRSERAALTSLSLRANSFCRNQVLQNINRRRSQSASPVEASSRVLFHNRMLSSYNHFIIPFLFSLQEVTYRPQSRSRSTRTLFWYKPSDNELVLQAVNNRKFFNFFNQSRVPH